jgi:hypothetical protein
LSLLLTDHDYIVYALSVSCSSTMTVLLRPFEFLARRLCLYCLGPFSFLLADYDYIVDALSVSCSSTMTILHRPFEFIAHRLWIYWLGPL